MSRELIRLYRALAADTDERVLPAPDQLRRRADRRARNRAVLGALAAAALAGASLAGSRIVLTSGPDTSPGPPVAAPPAASRSAAPTTGSPAPSPSRTTPPSRTSGTPPTKSARPAATTPTSIPDRAFFTLPAANDAGTGSQFVPGPVLPALCGVTPGEADRVARRARTLAFKLAGTSAEAIPDGSYRNSITSYRSGRADDALRQLRRAVQDCPEQPDPYAPEVTATQRLLAGGGYGDESVLFEIRTPQRDVNGDPTGGEEVHLVRAIRVGDVVTVLWEQGWEGTSTDAAQFDADSRRAVEALRRWLR
ncbi:hypothetical protein ONA70_04760 [Micromonospora yasonensis]|uniref:hypothetical protein n=1 Tax=Micromonospora yasonensis TaxID=1128667 RepID=UPI00222F936D|nr:hypothetical protein [Micromonospora yasonensis]MCW3839408.1 hypothetical protein [Micromonospora yasonensis]